MHEKMLRCGIMRNLEVCQGLAFDSLASRGSVASLRKMPLPETACRNLGNGGQVLHSRTRRGTVIAGACWGQLMLGSIALGQPVLRTVDHFFAWVEFQPERYEFVGGSRGVNGQRQHGA